MPDTKITALTAIGANPIIPATFPIPMVDLTDTSMAASGTTKKVTVNQILGAGGTATLASATITGDLTVDTSTLKVDSANDRVGIGTASPLYTLDVAGDSRASSFKIGAAADETALFQVSGGAFLNNNGARYLAFGTNNTERYKIDSTGIATWSNVGGVAGTAMTLNATGLGVGVTPGTRLHVKGGLPVFRIDNSSTGLNQFDTGVDSLGAYFRTYVVDGIRWYNAAGGIPMTLDASGNLLVGRTAALGGKIGAQVEGGNGAAYLLRHNGATAGKYRIFAIDGSNNGLFYDQNNVGMYMADAGTAWIATSDETQKDIIEPISNAISKVGSLRAVIGKFKTDANSVRRSFLIAQDVQTALPEAVHQKDGLLGLSYTDVIPLLVAAIKELTARVQTLETR